VPVRPPRPCGHRGYPPCPELVTGDEATCPQHRTYVRRLVDRNRRERDGYLYGKTHRNRFRVGVLRRDPYCRCDRTDHGWHPGCPCPHPSTDADHWPIAKRTLIAQGLDSDDPARGRGMCHRCHSSETAQHQPGGWHTRPGR
jgi:5-methylcytosine-specific restriction protein A